MTRLFYLPLSVLGAAFLVLCVHHGTAWPWNVVVHEDGRRTLLDTIFYFDHALGELPLDLLLSAAVAGAMLWSVAPSAAQPLRKLAAVCLALDAVIVTGALVGSGPRVAALYLFQFHTRDDQPMVYGSHWRYHLLSQAALMLLPLIFLSATHNRVLTAACAVFATLTIGFGITSASFDDARYLGHQARELFTHAVVTIPLAVGYIVGWTRSSAAVPPALFKFNWKPAQAFLLLSSYLAAGVLLTGAHHQGQSHDWTSLLCAHFFEHTFSYLIVPAHAKLFYLLGSQHA